MSKRIILFLALVLVLPALSFTASPKFYSDDPVWKEVDSQNASGVEEWEINLVYDLAENLFSNPGDRTPEVRAQNINTVDEVPDSSWYTNRKNLTAEQVAKG